MFRILIASLFVLGLLTSGCRTERAGRPHQGCHRVGPHLHGRHGTIHHHRVESYAPVDEKAK